MSDITFVSSRPISLEWETGKKTGDKLTLKIRVDSIDELKLQLEQAQAMLPTALAQIKQAIREETEVKNAE